MIAYVDVVFVGFVVCCFVVFMLFSFHLNSVVDGTGRRACIEQDSQEAGRNDDGRTGAGRRTTFKVDLH